MHNEGLAAAVDKMRAAHVDEVAVRTFAHYYGELERGATGMIPEESIEPVTIPALADAQVPEEAATTAISGTAVIKLNGGLGTSMGMDHAKSLLGVRDDLTFLDVIARQILHLRATHGTRLPLIFMNSFRTSADTLEALARYTDLPVEGLPLEFRQNMVPRLLADGLLPVEWPQDPTLEWCPPGHGDIYTALRGTGLLDALLEQGYERVFVSNSDNLGAVPDAHVAGWFAASGAPFAIEAVRRTPSDRKGGHFARRRSDGRLVLRETAQTLPEDKAALQDLTRHRYCSTNNLWIDLRALKAALDERDGILGLPMIRNEKTVDPSDPSTPKVIQVETAMGSAIEIFEGAELIEVGRDRFIPVKTTNDLLVLRSDVYDIRDGYTLDQVADEVPFIDLDSDHYKLVADFEAHFPDGVPSLAKATALRVQGDWTFGAGVQVLGDVTLAADGTDQVAPGTVLD
ncbi:UTP--glucose-1-phosphate uridylyltransferase [Nocardioides nematodiphilus]|uniref:UTP--glucose-1-phosphate uridylyltransferase n=1 Tax=Nocardioides nematodiphilus TaxID=2849669 RepID=UPI001CDA4137|nr:UTP--glucose-1-phosphate uridylyltransferase [Nocardioides nematodiphilus]MCA1983175.1 UTP--glucose-1-phosphate uridylyltransferase [Nocardioides nematodiphilus]